MIDTLTKREIDVVRSLARGLSNADISAALSIGEETVKSHLRSCYSKTKTHSRLALMVWARDSDLLTETRALT